MAKNAHIEGDELAGYFDNVVTEERAREIEKHWESCDACLRRAEEVRIALDTLKRLSHGYATQVESSIALALAMQKAGALWPRWKKRFQAWIQNIAPDHLTQEPASFGVRGTRNAAVTGTNLILTGERPTRRLKLARLANVGVTATGIDKGRLIMAVDLASKHDPVVERIPPGNAPVVFQLPRGSYLIAAEPSRTQDSHTNR